MSKILFLCAAAAGIFLCTGASARDICLDKIYLKQNSRHMQKLELIRQDEFAAADSLVIDSNVAFCGWSAGSSLVYVKDLGNKFAVYEYYLAAKFRRFITSGNGAIVHASIPSNGKYLLAKSLIQSRPDSIPTGLFSVVSLRSSVVYETPVVNPFVDYSATSFGTSYVREDRSGILEYFPDNGVSRMLLSAKQYRASIDGRFPITPFLSPDASTVALMYGGGGSYGVSMFRAGQKIDDISGLTSASEFIWIDSQTISYRAGGPGSYQLVLYSLRTRNADFIGPKTMNTNMAYSSVNGLISFLHDGCISFFDTKKREFENYPIEGEDVSFSPNGNSFCALSGGRLHVMQRETVKKRSIELKRAAAKMLSAYQDADSDKASFDNEYTPEYISRKIHLYQSLIR